MSLLDQELALLTRLVEAVEKIASALTTPTSTPLMVYKEQFGYENDSRPHLPYSDVMAQTTGRNVPEWVLENSPGEQHIGTFQPANTYNDPTDVRCSCGWYNYGLPNPLAAKASHRDHVAICTGTPQPDPPAAPKHKLVGDVARGTGEGFVTECTCGWKSPPFPLPNEAHHWFHNHVIDNTTPTTDNMTPEP